MIRELILLKESCLVPSGINIGDQFSSNEKYAMMLVEKGVAEYFVKKYGRFVGRNKEADKPSRDKGAK